MSVTAQAHLTIIIAALDGASAEMRTLYDENATKYPGYAMQAMAILLDDLERCRWLAMSIKSADKAGGKHPER